MTLPTLLFAEKSPGYYEAEADVPNPIVYSVLASDGAYSAKVFGESGRFNDLGRHFTLGAAFKACEAHFLRQRPA